MKKILCSFLMMFFVILTLCGCSSASVSDVNVEITSDKITYEVKFAKIKDEKYRVELLSGETTILSNTHNSNEFKGEFSGLKPDSLYKVRVCTKIESKNIVSFEKEVRTLKGEISKEGISFNDKTFTYDGNPKNIVVEGLPSNASVVYGGNGNSMPGVYDVVATISMPGYNDLVLNAKMTISRIVSDFTISDKSVVYDGNEKSLTANTELDVVYKYYYNNNLIEGKPVNAGVYKVVATYAGDETHEGVSKEATLTINKADYDSSKIALNDKTVTYDGSAKENLAECELELEYEYYSGDVKLDSKPVNAGEYKVIAKYAGDSNHNAASKEAKLIITKGSYDLSNVKFSNSSVTYDGSEKGIEIVGDLPSGVSVSYEYYSGDTKLEGKPINAGSYTVKAILSSENTNYNEIDDLEATLTINKASFDSSVLTIDSREFTYNKEGQAPVISSDIPSEISVSYEYYSGETKLDSKPINAGSYTVKAIFSGSSNYEEIAELVLPFYINKASVLITVKNVDVNIGIEYEVEYTVTDDLECIVSYYNGDTKLDGKPSEAGKYKVVVEFAGNDNYLKASTEAAVIINDPSLAILEINLSDITKVYGEEIVIAPTYDQEVDSSLITISVYDSESKLVSDLTNLAVGTYKVVVDFAGVAGTVNPNSKTVSLVVTKATYDMSGILFVDYVKTYDKEAYHAEITGTLPSGVSVSYEYYNGETLLEAVPTNAGSYSVKAIFSGNENYNDIAAMTITYTINKAVYDMSGVTFNNNYTANYTGEEISLEITGTLPSGVSVSYKYYSDNEHTNVVTAHSAVGTYYVVAEFSGNENYEDIISLTATLRINRVLNDYEVKALNKQIKGRTFATDNFVIIEKYNDNTTKEITNLKDATITYTDSTDLASFEVTCTNYKELGERKCVVNTVDVTSLPTSIEFYQIYSCGGNSGATYNQDYVVFYNKEANAIDLTGYYLMYATTGGYSSKVELNGVVEAHKYFSVGLQSGTNGDSLPFTPSQTDTGFNMKASNFKLALSTSSMSVEATAVETSNIFKAVEIGSESTTEGCAQIKADGTYETATFNNETFMFSKEAVAAYDEVKALITSIDFKNPTQMAAFTLPTTSYGYDVTYVISDGLLKGFTVDGNEYTPNFGEAPYTFEGTITATMGDCSFSYDVLISTKVKLTEPTIKVTGYNVEITAVEAEASYIGQYDLYVNNELYKENCTTAFNMSTAENFSTVFDGNGIKTIKVVVKPVDSNSYIEVETQEVEIVYEKDLETVELNKTYYFEGVVTAKPISKSNYNRLYVRNVNNNRGYCISTGLTTEQFDAITIGSKIEFSGKNGTDYVSVNYIKVLSEVESDLTKYTVSTFTPESLTEQNIAMIVNIPTVYSVLSVGTDNKTIKVAMDAASVQYYANYHSATDVFEKGTLGNITNAVIGKYKTTYQVVLTNKDYTFTKASAEDTLTKAVADYQLSKTTFEVNETLAKDTITVYGNEVIVTFEATTITAVDGEITFTTEAENVTVTATLTMGDVTKTKEFSVNVIPAGSALPKFTLTNESITAAGTGREGYDKYSGSREIVDDNNVTFVLETSRVQDKDSVIYAGKGTSTEPSLIKITAKKGNVKFKSITINYNNAIDITKYYLTLENGENDINLKSNSTSEQKGGSIMNELDCTEISLSTTYSGNTVCRIDSIVIEYEVIAQ